MTIKHPAKYTDVLIPIFEKLLKGSNLILDPFAGTGKIHLLPFETIGLEIEPEWANLHKNTIIGDATNMPLIIHLAPFARLQLMETEWRIHTKQRIKANGIHIPTN